MKLWPSLKRQSYAIHLVEEIFRLLPHMNYGLAKTSRNILPPDPTVAPDASIAKTSPLTSAVLSTSYMTPY